MPTQQRAAIVLRCWEDLTIEKTADLFGCPPGTVKSQTAQLTAENTTTITDLNATAARPTPPMTEEQLIAVALNPQLTINP